MTFAAFAGPPGGEAAPTSMERLDERLPEALLLIRAHAIADDVWLLGARDAFGAPTGKILRADPATGAVTDPGIALPVALDYITAVQHDDIVYLFGGRDGAKVVHDTIMRFDPMDGTVEQLDLTLPEPLWGLAGASDGDQIYLFGGRLQDDSYVATVQRFDPESLTLTTLPQGLPAPLGFAAAVASSGHIWLFGGHSGSATDWMHRFDPATGQTARLATRLPTVAYHVTAVADGPVIWLFGGLGLALESSDLIQRFVPGMDRLEPQDVRLPTARHAVGAARTAPGAFLVFGGERGTPTARYDEILRVHGHHGPTAVIRPVPAAECVGGRATITLDGSASYSLLDLPLQYEWHAPGAFLADPFAAVTSADLPFGATEVSLIVRDATADEGTAQRTVHVVDRQPPTDVWFETPAPNALYGAGFVVHQPATAKPIVVGDFVAEIAAMDACGVRNVAFTSAVAGFHSDPAAPYTYAVESDAFGAADVTILATARDLGGNTRTTSVTVTMVHDGPQ